MPNPPLVAGLHTCMDMNSPLVPGHRVSVALRHQDSMLDCIGAAQLDGSTAPFVPPPRQQLLGAVQAFRFMDSQVAFKPDDA